VSYSSHTGSFSHTNEVCLLVKRGEGSHSREEVGQISHGNSPRSFGRLLQTDTKYGITKSKNSSKTESMLFCGRDAPSTVC
jgi:hypothetical protein